MLPSVGSKAGQEHEQLCWCPPGSFKMSFEGTEVNLSKGFWMGKNLVTQEQYQRIMGENPSTFVGESLPAESMRKRDAMTFARKLTLREREAGKISEHWCYQLPTDAQWEYACRAGTSTAYSFGDDTNQLDEHAWYRDNSGNRTHPVGSKKANPWGLHDMHGNCLEFVRDAYLPAPPSGTDPEITSVDLPPRPAESQFPFALGRGGGWFFPAEGLQSRVRSRLGARDRGYQLGFRVALVPTDMGRSARETEIILQVEKYVEHFRDEKYKESVATMAPDMTVYAPFGLLRGMPVPEGKIGVFHIYQQLHSQGLRLLLEVDNIRVVDYGDLVLATYISRGKWWVPPNAPAVTRRVTQLWKQIDGQWFVVHAHTSDYRPNP